MRVFIVHAHPEPSSFNGAMTEEAVLTLRNAGHEVVVSDLYAMKFDPVSDRRKLVTVKNPNRLRQQDEEEYASERSGYIEELDLCPFKATPLCRAAGTEIFGVQHIPLIASTQPAFKPWRSGTRLGIAAIIVINII